MATFHVESNGQTFEIDAPDETTALRAFKGMGGGTQAQGRSTGTAAQPSLSSSSSAVSGSLSYEPNIPTTPTPEPAASSSWLHYPAMIGQSLANGAIAAINAPGELAGMGNKISAWMLPKILTTPVKELPALLRGEKTSTDESDSGGTLPYVNLGDVAKPQGSAEGYLNAALGGLTAGASVGGLSRSAPYALGAAAKLFGITRLLGREGMALTPTVSQVVAEVPRVLREGVTLGAAPAAAVEVANQKGVFDGMSPEVKTGAEALLGAGVGIVSHHYLSGDPVESVAKGLGKSENSDEAGKAVQDAVRDWRGALPEKIEALKGTTFAPEAANPDVTSEHLFGKVPLNTATTDMSSTLAMTRALAAKGGVFKPVLEQFGSDMPAKMKELIESIGQRNGPIETFSPKKPVYAGPTSAGPIDENPAQMTRPYEPGPTTPEGTAVVPRAASLGEVGFHIPEPEAPAGYKDPSGTMTGFRAPLRDAMELRSYIGELTSRGMMPKGSTEAQWSGLYKALTEDIGNTMEQHGAKPEWDNYNTAATKLYTAGNTLSKFSNDTNPAKDAVKPGEAVQSVWNTMAKDSNTIKTLREQVPEAADELAAGFLRSQPEKWNKLSPATREALVPNPFDRLALNTGVAKKPSLAEINARASEHMVGYAAGELLRPHGEAEGSTSLLSPSVWNALGIMAPTILHFAKKLKQNPRMMNTPITGSIAGTAGEGSSNVASSPLLDDK